MISSRFQPRRYQLKKEVCEALQGGHPWVFRDKVSTAIGVFPDGQWLDLVDNFNQTIGYGIYQESGGVAIRVLRLGKHPPDQAFLEKTLAKAIRKRDTLREETESYRLLNGESDGFPGVVLDVYNGVGVLQTYTAGVDSLGRFLASKAYTLLGLRALVWKTPSKRSGGAEVSEGPVLARAPEAPYAPPGTRILRGNPPRVVRFREGKMELAADVLSGQKSGTFLDLRGLRRTLAGWDLRGKKVLNLFAYTGTAGLACCMAGAREVNNVDLAKPSLEFGEKHHDHKAQRWLQADIFSWVRSLSPDEKFDLIVVDPPSMASNKTQVLKALATYKRLYSELLKHLSPGGTMVGCCCTSRISTPQFEATLRSALKGLKMTTKLPMEVDHKPEFSEANYLKILTFQSYVSPGYGAPQISPKELARKRPVAEKAPPPRTPRKGKPEPAGAEKSGPTRPPARGPKPPSRAPTRQPKPPAKPKRGPSGGPPPPPKKRGADGRR